jgi:hypothetical protein
MGLWGGWLPESAVFRLYGYYQTTRPWVPPLNRLPPLPHITPPALHCIALPPGSPTAGHLVSQNQAISVTLAHVPPVPRPRMHFVKGLLKPVPSVSVHSGQFRVYLLARCRVYLSMVYLSAPQCICLLRMLPSVSIRSGQGQVYLPVLPAAECTCLLLLVPSVSIHSACAECI